MGPSLQRPGDAQVLLERGQQLALVRTAEEPPASPCEPAVPGQAARTMSLEKAGGRFCSGKRAGLPAQRPFPVIQKVVASMAHLQEEKLRLQEELLALQEKLAARESEEIAASVQLRGQVGGLWARSGLPAVGCDV